MNWGKISRLDRIYIDSISFYLLKDNNQKVVHSRNINHLFLNILNKKECDLPESKNAIKTIRCQNRK